MHPTTCGGVERGGGIIGATVRVIMRDHERAFFSVFLLHEDEREAHFVNDYESDCESD